MGAHPAAVKERDKNVIIKNVKRERTNWVTKNESVEMEEKKETQKCYDDEYLTAGVSPVETR